MAKNRDDKHPVADAEESDVMDQADARKPSQGRAPAVPSRPAPGGKGLNLFSMYKPNQGKRIRLWSGVGAGLLIVGGWIWMYPKIQVSLAGQKEWLAAVISLLVSAVTALVVWYFVGVSRKGVDFLIATESEMKKVTWSSRKEVWGATKVVIGMVVLMAAGLFIVDVAFTYFFTKIGVLKTPF